ncbi:MAG: hypothetical protein K0Q46_2772 [Rhodococcus erythropolis]|jgi:hypothetical protein|nr:hypothetical protein [Rhodococcus erythropolis]
MTTGIKILIREVHPTNANPYRPNGVVKLLKWAGLG